MNITYERNISHCSVSEYVKEVTITDVRSAENSDYLDLLSFLEIGQNTISQKGLRKVGDKVIFIPPDSVLPIELTTLLNITKYTNKGRVRATRFRGNRSEGLVVDINIIKDYLPYILKWEDPPTIQMMGNAIPSVECPIDFEIFYHMPNILNEPFTFNIGEHIYYSEKIHGVNARAGILQKPNEYEYDHYVGSHRVTLKYNEKNLYQKIYNEFFRDRIPKDLVFFFEIYGNGVQHLTYGKSTPEPVVFAIMNRGRYLDVNEVNDICYKYNLPVVIFHQTEFIDLELIRNLANDPSEITDIHHREGIVMVSKSNPSKMAKCMGEDYLDEKSRKNKKERTERH